MDPFCFVSTVQGAGGIMVCNGILSLHTLHTPLVPPEHFLNITAYLRTVTDGVHPFMTVMYLFSDGCRLMQSSHKAQVITDWFNHEKEFTVFKLIFTVTTSHFNREIWECVGMGGLHQGRAHKKSLANVQCYDLKKDQNL